MANPLKILDNGTDISNSVDWKSIDAISILTKEVGTFKFNVRQGVGSTNKTIPQMGDTIELYDASGLMWGGSVTESEPIISGLMITWQVTATDWGFLMNGTLVKKNYSGVDPSVIVIDLITTFCAGKGITAATVADGGHVQVGNFDVPSIQFNYQQPSQALQSLANLIGWDWFIGPDKSLYFFLGDVDDGEGGSAVGDGGVAPITVDATSGEVEWNSLDIDLQITNMQNSVYVIGGSFLQTFTADTTIDSYLTDGVQQSFPVAYAYTSDSIAVTLNGVAQSVGILNQVTDPTTVDVLYDSSNRNIQFTAGAPTEGQTVLIFGQALVPIVANATDQESIAAYGLREGVISDSKITSVPEAQLRAQAQIAQFGHPVYDIKFNTLVPGCRIGQSIIVNVPAMGITNYQLVIKRVEAVGWAPGDDNLDIPGMLEYQVECIGSDNVTFVDLMTSLLQQEATQTTVSDTTIIEQLLALAESLTVTDAVFLTGTSAPYQYGPEYPPPDSGFDESSFDDSGFDANTPEAPVNVARYNFATYE